MITSDRAKNGRTHFVPLPPESVRLIREAMEIKSRAGSAYLFPSPRNKAIPVNPDALTRAMAQTMKALKRPLAGPHDLRRTGASMLASERCAVMPFIISQVLNHVMDAGGGSMTTRRHYNLYTYANEKRRALAVWEHLLLEIVGERVRPANVADLRQPASASQAMERA